MFTGDLQGMEMLLTLLALLLVFRLLGRYGVISTKKDAESGEIERTHVRCAPERIEVLMEMTGFDKAELKSLYRNFKNECPTGVATEERFKTIYGQFFPNGDSDLYAHYVFRTFDQQNEGFVTFQQFVLGLATVLKGSVTDKMHWTFRLYNIKQDGHLTREEMHSVVKSIYLLLGKYAEPEVTEENYCSHADQIFNSLDRGQKGFVTVDEFCESCSKDESIVKSMSIFDGVL